MTKCDEAGVPLSTAVFLDVSDPAPLQAGTLAFMDNQGCVLNGFRSSDNLVGSLLINRSLGSSS